MRRVSILLIIIMSTLLVSCSETQAKAPEKPQETAGNKQTVLFFMNPNGRPCQIQDSIINVMGEELTSYASIHYVKTTERSVSMPLFQKYGVRALPSLIVLDSNGIEKKRFSPGIQGPEQISQALK